MHKKYFSVLVALIFTIGLWTAGCSGQNEVQNKKEKYRIVTSFYPMYIATLNIAQGIEDVEVINMTKPQTGCLHDYQLTPEDLRTLENADVFVINGAQMESFLDKVLKQYANLKIVEASKGVPLLKEESGQENPHVWVSISDAILQVEAVTAQLSAIDSSHKAQYEKNAQAYIQKLQALQQEMHEKLDGLPKRDIVTFHEAFPYFAKEFRLNVAAVVEREPGTEPSPKELEALIQTIQSLGVKALFAEPQYPTNAADSIARETGAKVYILDPIVSGEANPGAVDDYLKRMRENMQVLQEALQ